MLKIEILYLFMVIEFSDVVFEKVARLTESYQVAEDYIRKFNSHKNLRTFEFRKGAAI